ncbi:fucose 4-O-acetylase-like acetyltransferase [Novosphingobium chloroacetimidivorans]|uniref:Fucose 4-O-acetylase-like acetyltransferase n=1 Tax=Novosphingobium chloroacetimidivorans TaxID=1428314 RepID=A0A7W7KDV3_9SPHN|nr:acyltransferase [Novosphingobium chloroacetimidivorans]MBB4860268.1 fucose 4-O-acetylase-like acetyltransferase [Novosphingobium chloroacetimidivorans]
MQSARVDWLDVARGIGIVLVVGGHAERGVIAASMSGPPRFGVGDLALYTFHMPLFMLLAGINVPASLSKGTRPFLQAKLWTVAYPYVLWSLIQGTLLIALSGMTNTQARWTDLAAIAWQPLSPFWFLYALFAFMVLTALVRSAAVLVALALGALWISGLMERESLLHQMAYMLPFFVIGMLGSRRIKALSLPWPAGLALAGVWLVAFQIVPRTDTMPYLTPWSFPAALAGIGVVFAMAQAIGGAAKGVLVALGEASMSIYVMHIPANAGARIALMKLDLPLPQWALICACATIGVLGPFAVHHALRSLGLLPVFGLARPASNRPDQGIGATPPQALQH